MTALGALVALTWSCSTALAAGDAAAGQHVFARCAACHSVTAGANGIGPSLAGMFGRKSGTEAGYNYSPALKDANITWDEATLDKFLQGPSALVHGTKMFVSVPSSTDRRDVIAYLETLSPSPNASAASKR
jgi:cytochrome c